MCDFTHLHTHSDGSTPVSGDGLGTVQRLVSAAKDKRFKSLALTDHGNLINTLSFIHACKLNDIKPITGLEAYIEIEGDNYHLTLLADGNDGFDTLVKLNNLAQNNYVNRRPAFKMSDFEKYNAGVTVLTGCPSSPLQKLDYSDALDIGLYLKSIFDKRLFSEIMFTGYNGEIPLERSVKLATKLNIPIVLTNDVHFPYASDSPVHNVLTLMQGGYDYDATYSFMATPDELEQRVNSIAPDYLKYYKQGLSNAVKLANKLTPVKIDNNLSLPKINEPDKKLNELIARGLSKRFNQGDLVLSDEVNNRLQYEFDTIKSMGFSTYFIILDDMVSYARSINVKVGSGRGSGAGSLILYVLGITDINPLEYDLKFERFINPKRLDFPDVDIDYDSVGRYKVIEYAKQRWNGIPVATYSRYSDDSLHNALGKHFNLDKQTITEIKDNTTVSDYYKKFITKMPVYDECYQPIHNQINHIGKHAGGIVITDKNIPMIKTSSGEQVACWTEGLHDKELSTIGVVKYDVLGISALDTLAELEAKHGKPSNPVDNSPVYELFQKGDTLGIFQFTQAGITEFTKKIHPTKFSELVAINAVWRPGAMQAAGVHYPEYKRNGQRLLHPFVDDILAETYGVIVYQEQFMSLYARVTGKDFGDADLARKILVKGQGKKNNPEWKSKLEALENEFLQGCSKNNIPDDTAKTIWSEIETHSGYSFNKSHAVSYTMLAWQLAYYKYYFRTDFYCASLNSNESKTEEYLFDVIKSGIEVVSPDINKSTDKYVSEGNKIYLPLTAIKGISDNGYDAILTNRPYNSISEFIDKVPKRKVNKTVRRKLYELGCFNNLDKDNYAILDIDISGEKKSIGQIQHECFGFVLPTKRFFEAVARAEKHKMVAGVIKSIEDKETKINKAKYKRVFLYPNSIVRTYDLTLGGFKEGDEVMFKVKRSEQFGHQMITIQELEYY